VRATHLQLLLLLFLVLLHGDEGRGGEEGGLRRLEAGRPVEISYRGVFQTMTGNRRVFFPAGNSWRLRCLRRDWNHKKQKTPLSSCQRIFAQSRAELRERCVTHKQERQTEKRQRAGRAGRAAAPTPQSSNIIELGKPAQSLRGGIGKRQTSTM